MKISEDTMHTVHQGILKKKLKRVVRRVVGEHHEMNHFVDLINLAKSDGVRRVLDVGCGYGRQLKLLEELDMHSVGVDINSDIVQANLNAGLRCMSPKKFFKGSELYDLIVMSHVIEHFVPKALLTFMESYLQRLRVDGYLLIVSPLMSNVFFDDFDHIRPYPPEAFDEIFVQKNLEVQFISKYRLELVKIRFRKRAIRIPNKTKQYWQKKRPNLLYLTTKLTGMLSKYSYGLIGHTDGWLGLYRNKGLRNEDKE